MYFSIVIVKIFISLKNKINVYFINSLFHVCAFYILDQQLHISQKISSFYFHGSRLYNKGHLISIGMYKKRIPEITPKNDHQREQAINALEELNQLVSERIKELKMDQ